MFFLVYFVERCVNVFKCDVMIIVLEPLVSISRIIIVNHALNINRVVVEVSEPSADVVCLNIMQVNIVADGCSEEGKEFTNVL